MAALLPFSLWVMGLYELLTALGSFYSRVLESAHGACCGGLTLLLCHWHYMLAHDHSLSPTGSDSNFSSPRAPPPPPREIRFELGTKDPRGTAEEH